MESTTDPEKGKQSTSGSPRRGGFWAAISRPFRNEYTVDINTTPSIAADPTQTPAAANDADPTPAGAGTTDDPTPKEETGSENDFPGSEDPKDTEHTKAENDAACSKLLNVYIGEAARYDKAVAETWKNNMTGLLIFSGLFSASLTAFIIESYKTLQADPTDTTNDLLKQVISLQPGSTGPAYEAPAPFQVTTAALACNILWFISLALSLTCSLLATLVDQWAREFIHKTDIRPAPVIRARALSFLYRGLQDFHMHAVVDAIPFLLHFSLFLFFGGLVSFLWPINVAVAVIVAVILGTFLGLYIFLTVLPVIRRACPYRTPLSSIAWTLNRYISAGIGNLESQFKATRFARSQIHHAQPDNASSDAVLHSMTDAALDEALKDCHDRDIHAVQWTLKSLTDDDELLPFVEAIPDLVCGHKGFRRDNDHLLLPILNTSDAQASISTRVVDLLRRSDNYPQEAIPGTLSRERIQIACLKAIWALGMIPNPKAFEMPHLVWFDSSVFELLDTSTLDTHYALSARVAVLYSWTSVILAGMTEMHRIQNGCDVARPGYRFDSATLQDIRDIAESLQTVTRTMDRHAQAPLRWTWTRYIPSNLHGRVKHHLLKFSSAEFLGAAENPMLLEDLSNTVKVLGAYRISLCATLLTHFLGTSLGSLKSCPYKFSVTCQELMSDKLYNHLSRTDSDMVFGLSHIPDPSSIASLSSPEIHDVDDIMMIVLRLGSSAVIWAPNIDEICRYITKRKSEKAIIHVMKKCDPVRLQSWITGIFKWDGDATFETIMISLILCKFMDNNVYPFKRADLYDWVNILHPLLLEHPSTSLSANSIVGHYLLNELARMLHEMPRKLHPPMAIDINLVVDTLSEVHDHPLLFAHNPDRKPLDLSHGAHQLEVHEFMSLDSIYYRGALWDELQETRLSLLSQHLSTYAAYDSTLYTNLETLEILTWKRTEQSSIEYFEGPVRPEIQCTFANGVNNLLQCLIARPEDTDLRQTLDQVWKTSLDWRWLDDVSSASTLIEVARYYLKLDRAQEGPESHEFYTSPVDNARRLLGRCLEVLSAAHGGPEISESRLMQKTMLSNFIRPAFPY